MPYKNTEAQKAAQHRSYLKNIEKVRASDKARIERNRKFVRDYKQRDDVICEVCGDGRWQVLDFHHHEPDKKYKSVSDLVKSRYPVETILEEINKCQVLCASCHRMEHNGNEWEEDSMAA